MGRRGHCNKPKQNASSPQEWTQRDNQKEERGKREI